MKSKEMIKRLNLIYKTFGEKAQRHKLIEECYEYITAIKDSDSNMEYRALDRTKEELENNIISEIADVFIVSSQLALNNPEIMKIVNYKIERTEKRIKSKYYEVTK